MRTLIIKIKTMLLLLYTIVSYGQTDSLVQNNDSLNNIVLHEYNQKLEEVEQQLKAIEENEKKRIENKKVHIDSLRNNAKGYPAIGAMKDTLFLLYSKIGASTPKERALNISHKIEKLYKSDFQNIDSILVIKSENTYDIIYGEIIIMSISENDAIWYGKSMYELAQSLKERIKNSIVEAKNENRWLKLIARIGLVLLVIGIAWAMIWLISKGYSRLLLFIKSKKNTWLKNLSYKDYTFLTDEQKMQVILFLAKIFRWFIYTILLYITLPIILSIFPFSCDWADALFHHFWSPFKVVLIAVWEYLPNLFSILVIYFVMKVVIRFTRYVFQEIEAEKLKISGFHSGWAMPTIGIKHWGLNGYRNGIPRVKVCCILIVKWLEIPKYFMPSTVGRKSIKQINR